MTHRCGNRARHRIDQQFSGSRYGKDRSAVMRFGYGSRMVKKLRLLKGGSVPTFLVLGRCCTTSLPWTLEEGRRGSQAILGYPQVSATISVLHGSA
jgi:hypothetical protein